VIIGYYSILPAILCTALLTALVSTPLFNVLNAPPTVHPHSRRILSIDGLRGYLALAVVFHHIAIMRLYLQRGTFQLDTWEPPPSRFFALLGPAALSMFFMITGYLFWSRVLQKRAALNWSELYFGRLFRIGPLYLFAVGLALLLDHLHKMLFAARIAGTTTSVTKQAADLLFLGLSVYPDNNRMLAGVTWSIHYEWLFYLSLPVLGTLCLLPRLEIPFLVSTLAACLSIRAFHHGVPAGTRTFPILASLFVVGMICATLQDRGFRVTLPDWATSLLSITLLASAFAFHDLYTGGPVLLIGSGFYLLCSGCSLFGLLTSRGATRLGDVSYSIYMLQGLAFALCLRPVPLRDIFLRSPLNYWLLTFLTLIVLLLFATLTYCLIERPGVKLGRRMTHKADKVLGLERSVA